MDQAKILIGAHILENVMKRKEGNYLGKSMSNVVNGEKVCKKMRTKRIW